MILDTNLTLLDAVAVDSAAGTTLEGDVIDLGVPPAAPGNGGLMHLVIQVTTTFTSGGSAIVQFVLASDAQAAITTDGTETRHALSDAYAFGDLVAGTQIVIPLPFGHPAYERYLGLLVVTSGATTTAGSISAFLTQDVQNWKSYADAVN